jgi:hypothetical protein
VDKRTGHTQEGHRELGSGDHKFVDDSHHDRRETVADDWGYYQSATDHYSTLLRIDIDMDIPGEATAAGASSFFLSSSFSLNNEALTSASALNLSFSILLGENAGASFSLPSRRLTYDPLGDIPCGVCGLDMVMNEEESMSSC